MRKTSIVNIIKLNCTDPNFNTATLASMMSLSERQLHRTCIAEFGVGPSLLIRTHRIEIAKESLHLGRSIEEAAKASGFNSVRTLHNAFKQIERISIGQYSRQHTKRDERLISTKREQLTLILRRNFKSGSFNVSEFASEAGVSERELHRKCRKLFDLTPHKLLENTRIEQAIKRERLASCNGASSG